MPASEPACNLIVDSCCELPRELCDAAGLTVLNFTYTEGDAELAAAGRGLSGTDDMFESMSAHDFYEAMRNGAMPMTSQPSQLAFEETFRTALDTGRETVYLAFSSGLSGCYEGACMAAERLASERGASSPEEAGLYIVDLKLGSAPEGLIVAEAVRQRDNGLTALRRGGRIPAGVAIAGAKLDVKPLLTIDIEGRLSMAGVVRGRKKGLRRMAEFYEKCHAEGIYSEMAAVGNADAQAEADHLCELIERHTKTSLFLRTNIGPTIGCHVGPGMICLSFWGDDRRRQTSISDKIAGMVRGK